ncbi:MAG: 6-hydroxymethylpterin diphosphokinase MptE-like protein [Planctomycetota bacterium]
MPIDQEILERNLRALATTSPDAARAIGATLPLEAVEFTDTDDGVPSARLHGRTMVSRRRPLQEAQRLAETIDRESCGLGVVLGFGMGYQVAALAERLGDGGALLAVEPDLGLLRSVLERVDHSELLGSGRVAVLTDPSDQSAIAAAIDSVSTLAAVGVKFLQSPADAHRLAGRLDGFSERLEAVIRGLRSQLMTTLLQVETTVRNELMNADHYARSPGIAHLRGVLTGRTAVVVSAGPSLSRNIHLLAQPGIRDKVCIVAVQTTLKPLLALGVRPHFVTALDYSDISTRFFEGLTEDDLRGVPLIAEAHGNPAILDCYPGEVLCPTNEVLDQALSETLAPLAGNEANALRAGATVAHLAYYFARHLGCDPVALIGQDLGFTDGQYYAAGAAIHNVWAGELSPFRSLESLEWERIARQGTLLHRLEDVFGRPIYTDEQMNGYLQQFQRDFRDASRLGQRTIDATEGGVRKQNTEIATLAAVIAAAVEHESITAVLERTHKPLRDAAGTRLPSRLRELRSSVWRVGERSRDAMGVLDQMLACEGDTTATDRLVPELHALRDQALAEGAGYQLTHYLNQTGSLKRFKDDRNLGLAGDLTPAQRQRHQITRDRRNVEWLAESADLLGSLLDDAIGAHDGKKPKITRQASRIETGESSPKGARVWAIVAADTRRSGLGHERDLARPVRDGKNALRLTLERLAAARCLEGAIVITEDIARAQTLVGGSVAGLDVRFEPREDDITESRLDWIAAARRTSPSAWRGTPGNTTVWDEAFWPGSAYAACETHHADAAIVVGGDWCAVCPDIVRDLIEYHRENPQTNPVALAHTAPGLSPFLVATPLLGRLASERATLGAAIRFDPRAPSPDLIGRPACVKSDPAARDLAIRAIADTPASIAALGAETPADTRGTALALADAEIATSHIIFETGVGMPGGLRAGWLNEAGLSGDRPLLDPAIVYEAISPFAASHPFVSFEAPTGDTLAHPDLDGLITAATEAGASGVHVRTTLSSDAARLAIPGIDLVSFDLFSMSPELYAVITGDTDHADRVARARSLIAARSAGLPWTMARITRCDAVYEEIESFYAQWSVEASWAAIDPMPTAIRGDRIAPLPLPRITSDRLASQVLCVLSDGTRARGRWPAAIDSLNAPIAAS